MLRIAESSDGQTLMFETFHEGFVQRQCLTTDNNVCWLSAHTTTMLRHTLSREAPVRANKLRFGLLSADEIARMAVVKVTETTLYYRGLPASGGLLDPLMGTVDRRHLCASCNRDARSCQGHAGYIELSFPVFHIGFVDTVLKVLRIVCHCCSRICLTEEDIAGVPSYLTGRARFNAVYSLLRSRKTCPSCGMPQPSITRVPLGFRIDWPEETCWECEDEKAFCSTPFTARDALSILRHMTDSDIRLLGFDPKLSHPQDMIVQNIVVPAPCTRPAIYTTEGSRSRGQNDLTMHLLEVLKRSHDVRSLMGDEDWRTAECTPELLERVQRLQYEVFVLVNNNTRIQKPVGMGRGGSAAHSKSLHERLKGKEGRVRGNLMGKRVDFSARCVITPDATFDCDRVGVPYRIACTLTVPEVVNTVNVHSLAQRVRVGAGNVNGADAVLHSNGTITQLRSCSDRNSVMLRPGDVVERYLQDDDVVVFNRQPSLHMHSMVAHRVRLMPGHTFRLSLVVAAPYNADFDGDEMNIHVPQSKAAAAECMTLMAVAQNCMGSQSNKPVMGIVQDSLLGLHIMSHCDITFDHPHVCRILGALRHYADLSLPPAIIEIHAGATQPPRRLWTGKQLISMLLPRHFYTTSVLQGHCEDTKEIELPVIIHNSNILCGVLRKTHLGTSSGGIVDVICREEGGVACLRFMGNVQRMARAFLLQRAHHVGIHDVMLSAEGQRHVHERLNTATQLCEEIQREVVDTSSYLTHTAEQGILRLLSKTLLQTGGIVNENMNETNAIRRMVTAGSKGSFINLSQICAALGQQSLDGKRIVPIKGERTLPCFAKNDVSLASRGFVHNSFALGLEPHELFYHAIGGREGLVDTAVKTSDTGYLQRRMNKSMEDVHTTTDGFLCNSIDDIISFRWGTDGMHPTRLERVKLGILLESEASIQARMTSEEAAVALHCRKQVLRTRTHVLATEIDVRVLLPFNPERIRHRVRREYASDKGSRISAAVATERVLCLARDAPCVVAAALLDIICYSKVQYMDAARHAMLVDELTWRIRDAITPAGVSVGSIAAQSTGEPCTQSASTERRTCRHTAPCLKSPM